ncbi:glycosyltransferase, partial [bacterium]
MKFYVLNNGLLNAQGMSGSDQRALFWSKIFASCGHSVTMVIPEAGMERYAGFDSWITSKDAAKSLGFIAFIYLWRALKTAGILFGKLKAAKIREGVVYSSSDLLPDSIPALYAKLRIPSLKWISGLHLIAPNPLKGFRRVTRGGIVFPEIKNIYYYFSQRLILFLMRRYSSLVMVSNSMDREFLLKRGFSSDQVLVTHGAVDWTEINSSVKRKEEFSACYIGRFHQQKGFFDLVEAWKIVCAKLPEALLAIIGTDTNMNEVIGKVRDEGLSSNIKFLGFLSGSSKFEVLKSSKLLVFPSTYESFGMVAAEGMACGLPVVAYALPIYEEIYP